MFRTTSRLDLRNVRFGTMDGKLHDREQKL